MKFAPGDGQAMPLACLWSHWNTPSEASLDSFALITDVPPPEVAAAGHDRCSIPLKPAHIESCLSSPAAIDYQALLEDKLRPYYALQLAA